MTTTGNDDHSPIGANDDDENILHLAEGQEQLVARLVALRQQHRDLDDSIQAFARAGTFDQLQVQRFKKRKLMLRDEINKLEAMLHPDIIA